MRYTIALRLQISQEIKLLAHLRHTNIIAFVDNIIEDGIMHIVMEYATGGTLQKKIAGQEGELFTEVGTRGVPKCLLLYCEGTLRHSLNRPIPLSNPPHYRTRSGKCLYRSCTRSSTSTPAPCCTAT